MVVSNRIRFLVWIIMIAAGYFGGLWINDLLDWSCPSIICIPVGLILLALIIRASSVTGRYLAVYGKKSGKGFGEIDKLVTVGPYSCMRHPMHFFLSLFPIALGLLLVNPGMSFIIGPVEMILILSMAILIDEKESIERFGEEYLEYKSRVPAFNLHPRCLWLCLAHRPSREE